MPTLALFGRLCFAALFLGAAPRHFTMEAITHARDLGVPLASVAVPLSGLLLIVGGLSLLLGFHSRLGAAVLVAFLLPVTFSMHAFWKAPDAPTRHVQLSMFMKNVALLGAALMIAQQGAGPLSLDALRARRQGAEVPPPR